MTLIIPVSDCVKESYNYRVTWLPPAERSTGWGWTSSRPQVELEQGTAGETLVTVVLVSHQPHWPHSVWGHLCQVLSLTETDNTSSDSNNNQCFTYINPVNSMIMMRNIKSVIDFLEINKFYFCILLYKVLVMYQLLSCHNCDLYAFIFYNVSWHLNKDNKWQEKFSYL